MKNQVPENYEIRNKKGVLPIARDMTRKFIEERYFLDQAMNEYG